MKGKYNWLGSKVLFLVVVALLAFNVYVLGRLFQVFPGGDPGGPQAVRLPQQAAFQQQIASLREELSEARSEIAALRKIAGYSELAGPGIVVEAAIGENQSMLGYDVRDIVNELCAAGAKGIEIGGERVVATTAVRVSAGRLLVNHRPVGTDPLVIKAVGDPEVLLSSLNLLINAPFFELDVSVSRQDSVELRAYRP